ncbi:MAG: MFS transporter, partial [Planctomycetes bacterium]|nr:MFS transporter [Planctomycetota bacterium]
MPEPTVISDLATPLDTAGRPITPSRLHRAMRLNIAVGIMGAAWFTVCAPQQIMTVFYKNDLGATPGELGIMVSLVQLCAVFHLAAIFIYSHTRTRKAVWVTAHVLHRLLGFVLAGVSVYAAQGGDKGLGTKIVSGAMVVSWVLTTSTASGWWSWMADLVPENIRATFFGRRATIVRAVNMVWFFGVTLALDEIHVVSIFYVYAAVFAVGGVVGVLDIALHAAIPEPDRGHDVPRMGWREFTEPLRNRNFLGFSLAVGAWSFSVSVLGPFVAPYITAADGIGAPKTWLGINAAIIQLTMIATGTAWGVVMDRFGRKPAVLLGSIHPIATWIGCFFMTPGNYPFILISTALVAGLLAAGFWDGSAQLMLTLTPAKNRNAYLSWHMATVGIIAAGGSYLGGILGDAMAGFHYELWAGFVIGSFHIVAAVSFVLSVLSVLMLVRIREGSEKPVGFVVTRLFTPGVFRTFMNLGTITGPANPVATARALRTLDGASSQLAVTDVMGRLDDPDPEVREEAVRALGRAGSLDSVETLIERLRDPASTIRPDAAQALGRIGDPRAVPALTEALADAMPEVRHACALALKAIGKPRESERAIRGLRALDGAVGDTVVAGIVGHLDDPDVEVQEEAARALGRIGSPEAVGALLAQVKDSASAIRTDAARALGRIGDPRAVPALVEALNSGPEELAEAAARALGSIGDGASRARLRRLLHEPHTERVFVSGAEAISHHGILEAAWEILPRMHDTANPVLRRQLAIAMGNLLGRPGEFYAYLTSETAQQG